MDKFDDKNLKENLLSNQKKVLFFEEEREKDKEKSPNNFDDLKKAKRSFRIVEKELSQEEKQKIFYEITKDSLTYMLTIVPQLLLNTINLIFLGHSDKTLIQANSVQIGIAVLNVVGLDFAFGSMNAFELMGGKAFITNKSGLLKIYHEARIFCLLIFLLLILPFGYSGDYILYFLGLNDVVSKSSGDYIKISLLSTLFVMFNQLNIRLMFMNKMITEIFWTNMFILGLHLILCMVFITTFALGAIGAAIALVISTLFFFLVTCYLLSKDNPFSGESFYMIDTDSLSSSKFYYYAVLGSKFGIFSAIRHLPRNFIILASFYLNWTDFTANCILHNYICMFIYLIVGNGISFKNSLVKTLGESCKMRNFLIEVYLIIGVILGCSFSLINYWFKDFICYLYIGIQFEANGISNFNELCDKITHIVALYSIFIFFEWLNNNCVAILKALNIYKSTNLIESGLQLTIFLPLALLLSYTYGYGYAGIWYSIFASGVLMAVINLRYLLNLDFKKVSELALKETLNYKRSDDEVN